MYKLSKINGVTRLQQLLACRPTAFPIKPLLFISARLCSLKFWNGTRFRKTKVRKTKSLNSKLRRGTLLQSTWDHNESANSQTGSYSQSFIDSSKPSNFMYNILDRLAAYSPNTEKEKQSEEIDKYFRSYYFPATHESEANIPKALISKEVTVLKHWSDSVPPIPVDELSDAEIAKMISDMLTETRNETPPVIQARLIENSALPMVVDRSHSTSKQSVLFDLENAEAKSEGLIVDVKAGTVRTNPSENNSQGANEKQSRAWEVTEFLNKLSEWRPNFVDNNALYFLKEKDRLHKIASSKPTEAFYKLDRNDVSPTRTRKATPAKAVKYKPKAKAERKPIVNKASKAAAAKNIMKEDADENLWEALISKTQQSEEVGKSQGISRGNHITKLLTTKDGTNWMGRSHFSSVTSGTGSDGKSDENELRAWAVYKALDKISNSKSSKHLQVDTSKTEMAMEESFSKVHRSSDEIIVPPEFEEIFNHAQKRKHMFFQTDSTTDDIEDGSMFSDINMVANEICNALNKLPENYNKKKRDEKYNLNSPMLERVMTSTANKPKPKIDIAKLTRIIPDLSESEIQSILSEGRAKSGAKETEVPALAGPLDKYSDEMLPVELVEDVFKGQHLIQSQMEINAKLRAEIRTAMDLAKLASESERLKEAPEPSESMDRSVPEDVTSGQVPNATPGTDTNAETATRPVISIDRLETSEDTGKPFSQNTKLASESVSEPLKEAPEFSERDHSVAEDLSSGQDPNATPGTDVNASGPMMPTDLPETSKDKDLKVFQTRLRPLITELSHKESFTKNLIVEDESIENLETDRPSSEEVPLLADSRKMETTEEFEAKLGDRIHRMTNGADNNEEDEGIKGESEAALNVPSPPEEDSIVEDDSTDNITENYEQKSLADELVLDNIPIRIEATEDTPEMEFRQNAQNNEAIEAAQESRDFFNSVNEIPQSQFGLRHVVVYSEATDQTSQPKPIAMIGPNYVLTFPVGDSTPNESPLLHHEKTGRRSDQKLNWVSKRKVGSLASVGDMPRVQSYNYKTAARTASKYSLTGSKNQRNRASQKPAQQAADLHKGKHEVEMEPKDVCSDLDLSGKQQMVSETCNKEASDEEVTNRESIACTNTKADSGALAELNQPEPVNAQNDKVKAEAPTIVEQASKREMDFKNETNTNEFFSMSAKTEGNSKSLSEQRQSEKAIMQKTKEVSKERKDAYSDAEAFTYEERKGISELMIHFKADGEKIAPKILHDVLIKGNFTSSNNEKDQPNNENGVTETDDNSGMKMGEEDSAKDPCNTEEVKVEAKDAKLCKSNDTKGTSNKDKKSVHFMSSNNKMGQPNCKKGITKNADKCVINMDDKDLADDTCNNEEVKVTAIDSKLCEFDDTNDVSNKDKKSVQGIESMGKDEIVRVLHEVLDEVLSKTLLKENRKSECANNEEEPEEVAVSEAVLVMPKTEVGPGASKRSKYKNPEYYSYHKNSFHEAEVGLKKYRLPQPSSKKNGGCSKK